MTNYELTKEKKLALLQQRMIDILGEQIQPELLELEALPLQDRIIQELQRFIYHNYNWNPTITSEMDFDWSEKLTTKYIWAVQLLGEYNQITNHNLSWTQILEGK